VIGEALTALLRRDKAIVLAALAVAVAFAWTYLLLGAGVEMKMMYMGGGAMTAMPPEWSLGYAAAVFVMWAVMMMAMMLPSAAPVVLLAAALDRQRNSAVPSNALFVSGYLVIWVGFSLMATIVQWALDKAGLLSDTMAASNRLLAAGVLVAAGLYQWMPLKQACLTHCRSPAEFLVRHWREARFVIGMRHGLFCLGCCWMLMALLFVGGLMNLAWIAVIAVLVLIEKTLPWGGWTSRLTGIALIGWGAAALTMAR
jgi:predicted metal-binding membrane protein